jgi:hypothetical protein
MTLALPLLACALAGVACRTVREIEVPTTPEPCRIPHFPDVGEAPDFVDCDGAGPGETVCVSPEDLAHLGAVLNSIVDWREAVLACPDLVVDPTTSRFAFPGLGAAVRRAGVVLVP